MIKNLVIVESPAKAKTIENFLGNDFKVTSCYGHIRDLDKKKNGVDIENDFEPIYIVPAAKKDVVKELKKLVKDSEYIWLASDSDREGEAISWHLKEELKLKSDKTKRIIFSEITKTAILEAINNPLHIDDHLVDSQQARRILDRLVGFELSPILWRKIKTNLSAGRVQSVAVRLVVEREMEIDKFSPESKFKVIGYFLAKNKKKLKAEYSKKFDTETEAENFLKECVNSDFIVESVEKKPTKKTPSPPFTTSTLQQEASRKLRFSVTRTMMVAQRLYEAGKITYMRTDSVNLSDLALSSSKTEITNNFGKKYSKTRKFKTKSASAQEAHEAIRPSYFDKSTIEGTPEERALYELIWKRAIASQMADAEIERTTIKIINTEKGNLKKTSDNRDYFSAIGEVIKFDGFLKVYLESSDDEENENEDVILPKVEENEHLQYKNITATERFSRPPSRYSEASLVKKLEEMGIGRPSTYAPTISTIQKRGYVEKGDREGTPRKYVELLLTENEIKKEIKTEITGSDKGRLLPTDMALLVNEFLLKYFPDIMDYRFTAEVEKELDEIAEGNRQWKKMISDFYFPFHQKVEETIEKSDRVKGERVLGKDPKTGKQVSVRMARFGPVAVLSNPDNEEEKPIFAGLRAGQRLDKIELDEALDLFKLPRNLGDFENDDIIVSVGRFGPYVRNNGKFYSLNKEQDPYTITSEEAKELIIVKQKEEQEKLVKTFNEDNSIQIRKGRYGLFIKAGRRNIRIPKDLDAEKLTFSEVQNLINKPPATPKKGKKK